MQLPFLLNAFIFVFKVKQTISLYNPYLESIGPSKFYIIQDQSNNENITRSEVVHHLHQFYSLTTPSPHIFFSGISPSVFRQKTQKEILDSLLYFIHKSSEFDSENEFVNKLNTFYQVQCQQSETFPIVQATTLCLNVTSQEGWDRPIPLLYKLEVVIVSITSPPPTEDDLLNNFTKVRQLIKDLNYFGINIMLLVPDLLFQQYTAWIEQHSLDLYMTFYTRLSNRNTDDDFQLRLLHIFNFMIRPKMISNTNLRFSRRLFLPISPFAKKI